MTLSRRDALRLGLFGTAAMALPLQKFVRAATPNRMPESQLPAPFSLKFRPIKAATPVLSKQDAVTGAWVDYYDLQMAATNVDLLGNGLKTPAFTYNGQLPGPTIRARQGRKTLVRHTNNLPSTHPTLAYRPWTSVHLHGSASLPQYDGYASDITEPQSYKTYRYPNHQPARTIWYHDHGVHHTAENAYSGLIAQYHLSDGSESVLQLPQGPYDVELMVHDIMFQSNGSILFNLDDESGMWGDVVMVNGTPWPYMEVEPRKYRFRFLVANVSRSYEFSLSTGGPMWIIGSDGGYGPYAQKVTRWRHGMAERYDVIIDFAPYAGKKLQLLNTSPKKNTDYTNTGKVMEFRVGKTVTSKTNNMPQLDSRAAKNVTADRPSTAVPIGKALSPAMFPHTNSCMDLKPADAVNNGVPVRRLVLERSNSKWTINKTTWADVISSGYNKVVANPRLDTSEVWEIANESGGWFHPVHIHLVDFKILSRNGAAPFVHELFPKDVVYLGPNETVKVLMKFETLGRYMVHCHNLIHEDHDMMTQFAVVRDQAQAPTAWENNSMNWDDYCAEPYRGSSWWDFGVMSLDPVYGDPSQPCPYPMPPIDA